MSNQAFLDKDGIIYSSYNGNQDRASAQTNADEVEDLINTRVNHDQPALVIVDLSSTGHISLGARQVAARAVSKWPFTKIAIVGTNTYLRHVAKLVLMATNRGRNIEFFPDQRSAKEWLKAK